MLSVWTIETGGLFRMASKMMQAEGTKNSDLNVDTLMSLLGRYYQMRDDYIDLTAAEVLKHTIQNDIYRTY